MANECVELLRVLRKHFGDNSIKLPKGIQFIRENAATVRMNLTAETVRQKNMQIDDNSFEGWAVALRAATGANIILGVNGALQGESNGKNGHLGRFFYRAMRFSEQYSWLSLDGPYLEGEVKKFRNYITNGLFINNFPDGELRIKKNPNKENIAEARLSEPGVLRKIIGEKYDIGGNEVYRQLPVGVFAEKVSAATRVFPGSSSAIDLWTWNGSDFIVVELKSFNHMVGIVTEIFFYANTMRDLLLEDGCFTLNPGGKKNYRGYADILTNQFKKITGIMLADAFHPLVNQEIVDVLNRGNSMDIEYVLASYEYAPEWKNYNGII